MQISITLESLLDYVFILGSYTNATALINRHGYTHILTLPTDFSAVCMAYNCNYNKTVPTLNRSIRQ